MSDTVVKRTQTELVEEMKARFGDDINRWAFICPQCGDIATVQDFKDVLADRADERERDEVALGTHGQNCIGRLTDDRGCDWAAYGLFSGPEFVVMDDGSEVPCFAIAPAGGGRNE